MEEKDEKKFELFLKQKALLETFLKTGAIDKAQYEKSLFGMAEKMGFADHLADHSKEGSNNV